ncbi:TPA: restriction endonuclease subunit S [Enterobacter roggenkampii]
MSGGKLPEGWATAPVSTVTTLIRGVTYKKEQALNYLQDDYLPLIRANNIQNGKFDTTDLVFVPKNLVKESQKISPEDIVIAMSSGSKSVVGKSAHQRLPFECSFGAFCGALRPEKHISPSFIAHFTKSSFYRNKISSLSAGANINNIKPASFDLINIPIPSFTEQKIIAEKLDTLLAQVDSTKARLEQIPQILKRFRQAVLEEAVSGRLTENWRDASISEKSAEELLVTISKTRKKNLTSGPDSLATESKRYLAKIDAHHFNIPDVILPVGWKWTTFLQSMEKVVDCHNKTAPYTEKGIYLIRTPDIRNGIISLKNTKYVNEDTYNFWSKRCPPRSGDIIFTREAPMGEAGIVPENTRLCMGQRMMLLRPMQSYLSNKYVLLNILSISFQARMLSQAIGTGVKHLRVADVESLMYPLPPLPEQHEIVRRVEQLFAYADTIEKQVNSALTRVNNLTQSILAKAFRGELTAQWRAENPDLISGENSAAALLEKIKAERAASGGKKTSRKKA